MTTQEEVVGSIYSALIAKAKGTIAEFSEADIPKIVDENEGKGATTTFLREIGMTLPDLLQRSARFEKCGHQKWRPVLDEITSKLAASIQDNKNKKGTRQTRTALPSRGCGFPIPRSSIPTGSFKHSGVPHNRRGAINGFVSRPGNGRVNGPAPPVSTNSEYINSGPPQRRGNRGPPSQYPLNGPERLPFQYERRPYRSPSRSYEGYRSPPRFNMNGCPPPTYNREYDDRRGFDTRNRNGPNVEDLYQDNRARIRHDDSYRRSLSPPNRCQSSRIIDDSNDRNDQLRDYSPSSNHQRYASTRNDSPSSHDSHFSQFSENSYDTTTKSTAKSRSVARAAAVAQPKSLEELAGKFNAAVTVSHHHQGEHLEGKRREKYMEEEQEMVAKKVAEHVKQAVTMLDARRVLLEDLIYEVQKTVLIPGNNAFEKEEYLVDLKKKFPERLGPLEIDTEESSVQWIEKGASSSYAEKLPNCEEGVMQDIVLQYINSIESNRFTISEVAKRLSKESGISRSEILEMVTYTLFVTHKGIYKYAQGSQDEIVKVSPRNNSSEKMFGAPLVHKMFQRPLDGNPIQVEISRFRTFEKFSVRPTEYLGEFEAMDKDIQVDMEKEARNRGTVSNDSFDVNDGCLAKVKDHKGLLKWWRGVVMKDEGKLFRVYLLDLGYFVMVKCTDMRVLPKKYNAIPPYAVACELDEEPGDVEMLNGAPWKENFSNNYQNTFITVHGNPRIPVEGIRFYRVKVFIPGVSGRLKNIIEIAQ